MYELKDVSIYEDDSGGIHSLSFRIQKGETLGLLSSDSQFTHHILSLLQGLYSPDEGEVLFLQESCRVQRKKLWSTVSFQVPEKAFPPDEKIETFIGLYQKLHNRHEKELFHSLVQKMDLNLVGTFMTLGEKNRNKLALLLALCEKSDGYVLLSPFTCLTDAERAHVMYLLHSYKKEGKTLVILQENFHFLSLLCDRVILFMEGEAIAELQDRELQLAREKVYHIVFAKAQEAVAFSKAWEKKVTVNHDRVTLKLSGSPNALLHTLKEYEVVDLIGGYRDALFDVEEDIGKEEVKE